ncbi:hypothetical protein TcasGA2_TC003049 [Tribolium castaneum]|uniref:Uncharacterized protein n=1 Tax=Tribolium castaneum TaxID=7070 RepID=D6WG22_TRICA|nr:hypothetical protein TcasGA2_TC003049 [Tribolium castaneum]
MCKPLHRRQEQQQQAQQRQERCKQQLPIQAWLRLSVQQQEQRKLPIKWRTKHTENNDLIKGAMKQPPIKLLPL